MQNKKLIEIAVNCKVESDGYGIMLSQSESNPMFKDKIDKASVERSRGLLNKAFEIISTLAALEIQCYDQENVNKLVGAFEKIKNIAGESADPSVQLLEEK